MANSGYSSKTISTFDIIGSYFVDVFYNHIYRVAFQNHTLHAGSAEKSLTDDYKMALVAYKTGLHSDKKYYEGTIMGILEYYRTYTKFSTITLNKFIGELLQQYLPDEHYRVLTEQNRYLFLNKIISDIVTSFIDKIITFDYIRMVIDNRKNPDNTRQWVDDFVRIQIIEREKMFNAFISSATGDRGRGVDEGAVQRILEERDKLFERLQICLEQKCKLESDLDKAKKVVEELYRRLKIALERDVAQSNIQQNNNQQQTTNNKLNNNDKSSQTINDKQQNINNQQPNINNQLNNSQQNNNDKQSEQQSQPSPVVKKKPGGQSSNLKRSLISFDESDDENNVSSAESSQTVADFLASED